MLYGMAQTFLVDKKTDQLYHIPQDATVAVRIDGSALMKNAMFEIMLEAQDETVLTMIEDQIKKGGHILVQIKLGN